VHLKLMIGHIETDQVYVHFLFTLVTACYVQNFVNDNLEMY